jgi:hypothetical protein
MGLIKCSPTHFFPKLIHNTNKGKNWATSIIKKLPKVINHPTGENSPNLVNLIFTKAAKNDSSLNYFHCGFSFFKHKLIFVYLKAK